MRDDPVAQLTERLRREADEADFRYLTEAALPRPRGRMALLRARAATALASTVFAVAAAGGVAYAADSAVPGEFLYGLDRALERVGIGAGGAEERIVEARELAARGRPGRSLEHVVLVVPDHAEAESALLAAAEVSEAVESEGAAAVVQEQVDLLLDYLATNVGEIDGATVAEYARAIRGDRGRAPDAPRGGPPEGTPGNGPPPDGPPGHGPPDEPRPPVTITP